MHIAEGVLSAPVLITGAVVAAAGIAYGLKKIPANHLMLASLLGSAFFVASLIHVPIGFSSAHLILNGLIGAILGAASFPIIFVALLLQAVLFQFGGFTVLGVNTATTGIGAWAAGLIFCWLTGPATNKNLKTAGFAAGFSGVFISGLLTALALAFSNEGFVAAAWTIFLSNLPVMFIEGILTAIVVVYIKRTDAGVFDAKTS